MLKNLKVVKLTIITCLMISLGACGFKLRGDLTIPSYLQTVYISPNDPYESFQRELRYRLKRHNVNIVNRASPDVTELEVSKPEISKQLLAESTSGQGQRFKLIFSIKYKIRSKDKESSQEQRSITRSRELSKTNNMLLSDENEEQLVKK
jgi:LPS-assembly lipoprotein